MEGDEETPTEERPIEPGAARRDEVDREEEGVDDAEGPEGLPEAAPALAVPLVDALEGLALVAHLDGGALDELAIDADLGRRGDEILVLDALAAGVAFERTTEDLLHLVVAVAPRHAPRR